jgi:tetratricopeptide (TPR) repeat protein
VEPEAAQPAVEKEVAAEASAPSTPWGRVLGIVFFVAAVSLLVGYSLRHEATGIDPASVPSPSRETTAPHVFEVIEEARQQVLSQPASSEAWGRLGMVLHAHGQTEQAIQSYERAIELDPEGFAWHHLIARALEVDEPERALEAAEKASELDPSFAASHLACARLLELGNRIEDARERYETAARLDSTSVEAVFGAGRLAVALGDLDGGIQELERAVQLAPNAGPIYAALSRAHLRSGNREAAAEIARRMPDASDEFPKSDPLMGSVHALAVSTIGLHRRARAAMEAGNPVEAEKLYRRLVQLEPDDGEVHFNLGLLLSLLGKFEEANASFTTALEVRPGYAEPHLHLGINRIRMGRAESAIDPLRTAVSLAPENGAAHHWLARALASTGNLEDARRHAATAVELGETLSDDIAALARN